MTKFLKSLKHINIGIAVIGGGLGVVTFFFPDLRNWFVNHGLIGWGTAIVLVIFGPLLGLGISNASSREISLKKDCNLVLERLGDWTITSVFYDYLTNQAIHNRFKRDISDGIQDRCIKWQMDSREIKNSALRESFDVLKVAILDYNNALQDETWAWDRGPLTDIDYDYVRVPPEWETADPVRFRSAYDRLNLTRHALVDALASLFSVLHTLQTT